MARASVGNLPDKHLRTSDAMQQHDEGHSEVPVMAVRRIYSIRSSSVVPRECQFTKYSVSTWEPNKRILAGTADDKKRSANCIFFGRPSAEHVGENGYKTVGDTKTVGEWYFSAVPLGEYANDTVEFLIVEPSQ